MDFFGKPVCSPADVDPGRYVYRDHEFHPADESDGELRNLIELLKLNEREFVQAREDHVDLVRDLFEICGMEPDAFFAFVESQPKLLSYVSALEVEFERTFAMDVPP